MAEKKVKNLFEDFACEWFYHKGDSVNKGEIFKVYKSYFNLKKKYKYKEIDDYQILLKRDALKKEISDFEDEYGFPRFSSIEEVREYFKTLTDSNDLTLARMSPSESPRLSMNPPEFYKFDREL